LCRGWSGIGPGHHEAPVGPLGVGGPDLLAGDDPLVAVPDGPRLDVGQVGAGVRLGVALAPELGPLPDRLQEPLLLGLGPVGDQGGPDQALPHDPDPGRGVGPGVLLVPDHLLGHRRPPAPPFPGPAETDPAVGPQLSLPGDPDLPALVLVPGPAQPPGLGEGPDQVLLQPGPGLGRKAASSGLSRRSIARRRYQSALIAFPSGNSPGSRCFPCHAIATQVQFPNHPPHPGGCRDPETVKPENQ
jgi:hypothetical protein